MTEIWKTIPEAPNFQASSLGRVRNTTTGNILSPRLRADGYLHLALRHDGRRFHRKVHQYIAAAFLGPAPAGKPHVAHGDGTRVNNRIENLRWASCKENHADREMHGRAPKGSRNGSAVLDEGQVKTIRQRLKNGETHQLIADVFGVCIATISNINTRKNWRHI